MVIKFAGWTRSSLLALFLGSALITAPLAAAQNGSGSGHKGPVVKAVKINPKPVIDGTLDEHAWRVASKFTEFYCNDLNRDASQPTETWICYDHNYVYIAFYCHDSEPGKIMAEEIKRGARFHKDDYVQVSLDTVNQRRWGDSYRFTVNARGTQAEQIPGGSASKVEWRGDWLAAAQRVEDGWTAEMAIPLAILRYPSGQRAFGVYFGRHLAREREMSQCPNLGMGWDLTRAIEWTDLDLPTIKPPLLIMPYSLTSVGEGGSGVSSGVDMKQTFNSGLTSLLSLKPDFRNIENQILDLSFSYTERFVEERRPFFVEGEDFFPRRDLFYTPRINTQLDAGFKTFGKMGNTRLGFLQAMNLGARSDTVFNMQQDFNERASVGAAFVRRSQTGLVNNAYGLQSRLNVPTESGGYYGRANLYATNTTGDGGEGTAMEMSVGKWASAGNLGWRLRYSDISKGYNPMNGFVPELDLKGWGGELNYFLRPEKGWVERLRAELDFGFYDHQDGSLFHRDLMLNGDLDIRDGVGLDFGYIRSTRPPHNDQVIFFGVQWNRLSLYESGRFGISFGRRASTDYRLFSFSKGVRLNKKFGLLLTSQFGKVPQEAFVSRSTQQHIISLNYDLSDEKGFGGRFVQNNNGTNFYLSYRQTMRKGMDAFLIIGDPNADRFAPSIALKMVSVWGRS